MDKRSRVLILQNGMERKCLNVSPFFPLPLYIFLPLPLLFILVLIFFLPAFPTPDSSLYSLGGQACHSGCSETLFTNIVSFLSPLPVLFPLLLFPSVSTDSENSSNRLLLLLTLAALQKNARTKMG